MLDARAVSVAGHQPEKRSTSHRPRRGERCERVCPGAEAIVLADHDLDPCGIRGAHDLHRLRQRFRERFLNEKVLAGGDGLEAEGGVGAGGGDDHHGVGLHGRESLCQLKQHTSSLSEESWCGGD